MQMQERVYAPLMGNAFKKAARLALPMLGVAVLALFANDVRLLYTSGRTVVPWFGVLVGFISPPADYFKPLKEVEVRSDRTEYRIEFKHKYYGGHSVEFTFPGKMDITDSMETGMSFRCSFRDAAGCLLQTNTIDNFVAYSDGRGSIGGTIAKYEVPKNLPIDDEVILCVEIDGSSRRKFFRDHPKATLSVVKTSDE